MLWSEEKEKGFAKWEEKNGIYMCGSKKMKHTQDKFEVFSSGMFLGANTIEKYSNKWIS